MKYIPILYINTTPPTDLRLFHRLMNVIECEFRCKILMDVGDFVTEISIGSIMDIEYPDLQFAYYLMKGFIIGWMHKQSVNINVSDIQPVPPLTDDSDYK